MDISRTKHSILVIPPNKPKRPKRKKKTGCNIGGQNPNRAIDIFRDVGHYLP